MKNILAIETSCDETSAAVVVDKQVVSNVVYSQLDLHKKYGGVVPSIARLEHQKKIDDVIEQALVDAKMKIADIDVVAVTIGPGLAIALEVGIRKAIEVARETNIPIMPINHMEGHLFSPFINLNRKPEFPSLGILVSGGHTELLHVKHIGEYRKIGQTLDDACGEAFDKAAIMLGLGYPGGPLISKRAEQSTAKVKKVTKNSSVKYQIVGTNYELPLAMYHSQDLNVSYSGLKTALKKLINDYSGNSDHQNIPETAANMELPEYLVNDFCKLFEVTAVETFIHKVDLAFKKFPVKQMLGGGGVVANKYLRERLVEVARSHGAELLLSELKYTGDNAAMIGYAAALKLEKSDKSLVYSNDFDKLDRKPRLSL